MLFLSFVLVSCGNSGHIYYGIPFEQLREVAEKNDKPVCLVLYDSSSFSPQDYVKRYSESGNAFNKAVFGFLDATSSDNAFYGKLFRPDVYPVSCIFDHNGKLIDLIPGCAKESMLYVNKVISDGTMTDEYHYNRDYGESKADRISYFNSVFDIMDMLAKSEDASEKIDSLERVDVCPYLLFLKIKNQVMWQDTVSARLTANSLLAFDTPKDLVTYQEEYHYANKIISSGYNENTAPRISISPSEVNLKDCVKGKTVPVVLKIDNKGKYPLVISGILTSCSCIEMMSDIERYEIYPDDHAYIGFYFTPDVAGAVHRDIFFASNDYDSPITHIEVHADVVSEIVSDM